MMLRPYYDQKDEYAVDYCKKCGGEIYRYDPVVYEDGERMHLDCFEDYVKDLLRTSPDIVADCFGMRYEGAI